MEAVERLALQRAVTTADDLIKELTTGRGPVVLLLVKAKREAAVALTALAEISPNDPVQIMALQNEVRRFGDLVRWVRASIDLGIEAENSIEADEATELASYFIDTPEGQAEAQALGINPGAPDL